MIETLINTSAIQKALIRPGGISFFSPRFGLASTNVLKYNLVLSSGAAVEASLTSNPDLWRALQAGGANNFGIVTSFPVRCFPCPGVWSGFLYLPSFQSTKVLAAFHDFLARTPYDDSAAGPLACFTYTQKLGIEAISVHLVCTKIDTEETRWPTCFATTPFKSLFRFWSTCKQRSLTSATHKLHALNTVNGREAFATTIANDAATIAEVHASYKAGKALVHYVKGVYWTLVLQPLLPTWTRGHDINAVHAPQTGSEDHHPLVLVIYTVSWTRREDDDLVARTMRGCIERIDDFADSRNTGHVYRFQNYCGEWQNAFEGRGEREMEFLRKTRGKYDPDGLFQEGCAGAFKLGL